MAKPMSPGMRELVRGVVRTVIDLVDFVRDAHDVMNFVCESVEATLIKESLDEERKKGVCSMMKGIVETIVQVENSMSKILHNVIETDASSASSAIVDLICESVEGTLIQKAIDEERKKEVCSMVKGIMETIVQVENSMSEILHTVVETDASSVSSAIVDLVCESVEATLIKEALDEERKKEVCSMVKGIVEAIVQVESSMSRILHKVVETDAECASKGAILDIIHCVEDIDSAGATDGVMDYVCTSVEVTLKNIAEVEKSLSGILHSVVETDASSASSAIVNFVCKTVEATLIKEVLDEKRKKQVCSVVKGIIETIVHVEDTMSNIVHRAVESDASIASSAIVDFVCEAVESTLIKEALDEDRKKQVCSMVKGIVENVVQVEGSMSRILHNVVEADAEDSSKGAMLHIIHCVEETDAFVAAGDIMDFVCTTTEATLQTIKEVEESLSRILYNVVETDASLASSVLVKFVCEVVEATLIKEALEEERKKEVCCMVKGIMETISQVENSMSNILHNVVETDASNVSSAIVDFVCESVEATLIQEAMDEERKKEVCSKVKGIMETIVQVENSMSRILHNVVETDASSASSAIVDLVCESVEATLIKEALDEERKKEVCSMVKGIVETVVQVEGSLSKILHKVVETDAECASKEAVFDLIGYAEQNSVAASDVMDFVSIDTSIDTNMMEEKTHQSRISPMRPEMVELVRGVVRTVIDLVDFVRDAHDVMEFAVEKVEEILFEEACEKERSLQARSLISAMVEEVGEEVGFQYTHILSEYEADESMEIDSSELVGSSLDENLNKVLPCQKLVHNADSDQFVLFFLKDMIMCSLHNDFMCSSAGSLENEQKDVVAGIDRFLSRRYSLSEKVQKTIINEAIELWLWRKVEMVVMSL